MSTPSSIWKQLHIFDWKPGLLLQNRSHLVPVTIRAAKFCNAWSFSIFLWDVLDQVNRTLFVPCHAHLCTFTDDWPNCILCIITQLIEQCKVLCNILSIHIWTLFWLSVFYLHVFSFRDEQPGCCSYAQRRYRCCVLVVTQYNYLIHDLELNNLLFPLAFGPCQFWRLTFVLQVVQN